MHKSKRDLVLDGVLPPSEPRAHSTGFAEISARSTRSSRTEGRFWIGVPMVT